MCYDLVLTVWGSKMPSVATYWLCYNSGEAYGGKSTISWFILLWDLSAEPSWSVRLSPMCVFAYVLIQDALFQFFRLSHLVVYSFGYLWSLMLWYGIMWIFLIFLISLNVFFIIMLVSILTWQTFIAQFGCIKSDYWFNFLIVKIYN